MAKLQASEINENLTVLGTDNLNKIEIKKDNIIYYYKASTNDDWDFTEFLTEKCFNLKNGNTSSGALLQKGATKETLISDFSIYGSAYAYLTTTNLFDADNGSDYIKYTLNDFNDDYDNIVKYTATAYVYTGGGSTFPTTGTFEEKYAQIKQILAAMIASGNYNQYINATIPQVEAGISQSILTDLENMGLILSPNVIEKTATLSTALGNNNKIYAPTSFANGYGNIVGDKGYPLATIGAFASGWNMKAWGAGAMAVGKRSQFTPSNFSGEERKNARIHIEHLQEIYNEAGDPYWKSTLPAEIATASTDADYDAITVEMGEAHQDCAIALGGSSTFDINSLVTGHSNFNTGINAVVFNNQNVNTGNNAILGGLLNINKSNSSLTVGIRNRNTMHNSFVAGAYITASSYCGITVGSGLLNTVGYKAVFGRYNLDKSNNLLEIGNGSSDTSKSNAFEVTKSGVAKSYRTSGTSITNADLLRKDEIDTLVSDKINTLDSIKTASSGKYISGITQTNGKIVGIVQTSLPSSSLSADSGKYISGITQTNGEISSITQTDLPSYFKTTNSVYYTSSDTFGNGLWFTSPGVYIVKFKYTYGNEQNQKGYLVFSVSISVNNSIYSNNYTIKCLKNHNRVMAVENRQGTGTSTADQMQWIYLYSGNSGVTSVSNWEYYELDFSAFL